MPHLNKEDMETASKASMDGPPPYTTAEGDRAKSASPLGSEKATPLSDNDSLAKQLPVPAATEVPVHDHEHRKSWIEKLQHEDHSGKEKKKRSSISDAGPLIFVYDPELGKEVLRKNPHWPNENAVDDGEGTTATFGGISFGNGWPAPK